MNGVATAPTAPYCGPERRQASMPTGVDPDLIAYLENRLDREMRAIEKLLRLHIDNTQSQMDLLIKQVSANADASEKRHQELVGQLMEHLDKTEQMTEAFLLDEHGNRDYRGHHLFHKNSSASRKWWSEVKGKVVSDTIKAAAGGAIVWFAMLAYQGFKGSAI